jgi:hypothetical protein
MLTRQSTGYSIHPDNQLRKENLAMLPQMFPESGPDPAKKKGQ